MYFRQLVFVNVNNRLTYLIVITTVIRLVIASLLELGNDEVYYFLYALHLQPNYFDHPPGVAVLELLTTFNLAFTQEIFIRLGPILCAALGTWMVYRLGSEMKNERTGWLAALLYNTSIYASVIAGNFIIPDSPQVVCWIGSLWILFRMMKTESANPSVVQWAVFGLMVGLTILCKVHGIFLWAGAGLYILLYRRSLLASPGLYLSVLITVVIISPIVFWNVENDFITYRFHSGRVNETTIHPDYFAQSFFGQWAYNNPINVVFVAWSLLALRRKPFMSSVAARILVLTGLPIIVVVLVMSLFNSMLPHWTGPGFTTLMILAAGFLDERMKEKNLVAVPAGLRASIILVASALVAAVLLISAYPGTIGSRDEQKYGDGDFTLDLYGWSEFGKEFGNWVAEEKAKENFGSDIQIVSHKWFPAAHLEYYVARPAGMSVTGVGQLEDLHQYYWLNQTRPSLDKGATALLVVPTNYTINFEETFLNYFDTVTHLKRFESRRGGSLVRYFDVYRLDGYRANDQVHQSLVP